MRQTLLRLSPPVLVILLLGSLSSPLRPSGEDLNVLLFTRAEGFVHNSIDDGIAMFTDLSTVHGFTLTTTDQTDQFTSAALGTFDVVIWLSTTGDVLDVAEEIAFEDYIEAGGGYVGIHAAADCEYNWPWYGNELLGNGAWFDSHPSIQEARLVLEDASHPTAGTWEADTLLSEEWYNFRENPRDVVQVIQTLDETSYDPGSGAMGDDHPIAWVHSVGAGRAFYSGLGHRSQTYEDERFIAQMLGAVRWAGDGLDLFSDDFESGDTSAWSGSTGGVH